MKFLKDNKGLIIFYLFMSLVTIFWTCKVDKENDMMLKEKSAYMLNVANN